MGRAHLIKEHLLTLSPPLPHLPVLSPQCLGSPSDKHIHLESAGSGGEPHWDRVLPVQP